MARPAEPAFSDSGIHDNNEAVDRLAQMGLRPDYFEAAIRHGHKRASRCMPVHPKTYPGQVMWAETVGELRTQLFDLNQNWAGGQTSNYETSYRQTSCVTPGSSC